MRDLNEALAEYKASVEQLGEFHSSDRKKLLSLPFLLAKRAELPEPRKTQHDELNLFKELYGMNWYDDASTIVDSEQKVT